jgi:hypothetical protein
MRPPPSLLTESWDDIFFSFLCEGEKDKIINLKKKNPLMHENLEGRGRCIQHHFIILTANSARQIINRIKGGGNLEAPPFAAAAGGLKNNWCVLGDQCWGLVTGEPVCTGGTNESVNQGNCQ